MMATNIAQYFNEGCGRCPLGGTPACKVHSWSEELQLLREFVRSTALKEEMKWGVPCYTLDGKNVLTVSAFKEYCSLSFFKGSLLADSASLLVTPGKNSQASRQFRFTSIDEIVKLHDQIREYIHDAIAVARSGKKVPFKKNPEPIPEELQVRFDEDPCLADAFYDLTPGRRRGYILHFSGAKQAETRNRRIDKYIPKIMEGKGFHDR